MQKENKFICEYWITVVTCSAEAMLLLCHWTASGGNSTLYTRTVSVYVCVCLKLPAVDVFVRTSHSHHATARHRHCDRQRHKWRRANQTPVYLSPLTFRYLATIIRQQHKDELSIAYPPCIRRFITSPARTVAKYCNEYVGVSVCLSARISPEPHARFLLLLW